LGDLFVWHHALGLQWGRILTAKADDPESWVNREIDLRLFVMALRQFIRSADLTGDRAEPAAGHEIKEALARFHRTVPGAVDLRDSLEHFDAYESGTGRLQRKAGVNGPATTWFTHGGLDHSINVDIPGVGPIGIRIGPTVAAADELVAATRRAVG